MANLAPPGVETQYGPGSTACRGAASGHPRTASITARDREKSPVAENLIDRRKPSHSARFLSLSTTKHACTIVP